MVEKKNVLDELLDHGPSIESVIIVLTDMKKDGRLQAVVKGCMRFLNVYPGDIRLRFLLAETCLEMGFFGLGQAELERASSMINELVPVYERLARVYRRQGRFSEAADAIKCYLAHCPGEPEAIELSEEIGLAMKEEGPTDEAVATEEEPEGDVVDFASPTIAELYYTQGQLSAAISTYEKIIRSNPDDSASVNRLTELKQMVVESPALGDQEKEGARDRKEKMITILERLLPKIREIKHA